jgi:hypothetical protein
MKCLNEEMTSIPCFFERFSLKPFLKKLAVHQLITPLLSVFAQAFFEKACSAPVNHTIA